MCPRHGWQVTRKPLDGHGDVVHLREYEVVRVVKLEQADRPFDGTERIWRPPQVGDVATICHEYDPQDPTVAVAVEMVDDDGFTVWFANFNYRRYHKAQSNGTPADAFNGWQERKEV